MGEVNSEYTVSKRDWICTCLFMITRLLPCRHVFYLRKTSGKETVIMTHLLNKRWMLNSVWSAMESSSDISDEAVLTPYEVKKVLVGTKKPCDSNRKYREALFIASEICDTMSELGMLAYRAAMEYLQVVAHRFKKGEFHDPF
ncbi:hypothetical protein L914_21455 [Phytophthora nicotianae]|uniref:SWIM-type domain-containing protein n=1 Tax=Phytophthora nicotianae TaxID=4792 RepID=W2M3C7_PHYNI|nr:hypothetical protein L914_21455 [Phytophthora nicotianae]